MLQNASGPEAEVLQLTWGHGEEISVCCSQDLAQAAVRFAAQVEAVNIAIMSASVVVTFPLIMLV